VDGILNINKPVGMTSFSIVAMVKRLTGERRVGHAGTLDPIASGVLPVCLGQGTRVTEFLVDQTKTYRAQIELGVATDTYDGSGKITQRKDPSWIGLGRLEQALASFRGVISQTPPMYSAVKHHGKRLYQLARSGITVERRSRPAKIYHLELIEFQPPLVAIEVVCGKGTYIRSLAHDLGQVLGCGANLRGLVRSRCGLFDIMDAISPARLEDAVHCGYWRRFIYPIDIVLQHWTAMIVGDATAREIRDGRSLARGRDDTGGYCRAYTQDGCFLGVLGFSQETGQWHPEKVFCGSQEEPCAVPGEMDV